MLTLTLIVVLMVLVAVCGLMTYAAVNGSLSAQVWFACGGFGEVAKVIGYVCVAIGECIAEATK